MLAMSAIVLLFAAQATTVAELCAEPVDYDTKSPAPYCVFTIPATIETPYYTLDLLPQVVVHLLEEGKYLEVLPSVRQSPIGFSITVDAEDEASVLRSLAYYNCPDAQLDQDQFLRCERNDDGYVGRRYVALMQEHIVIVDYNYSPRALEAPEIVERFERMLASIKLKR